MCNYTEFLLENAETTATRASMIDAKSGQIEDSALALFDDSLVLREDVRTELH